MVSCNNYKTLKTKFHGMKGCYNMGKWRVRFIKKSSPLLFLFVTDGGSLTSDEDLSYYSGNESPPLSESDLCNSNIDTDELLSTSEYEETTPAPNNKALKKRGKQS